MIRFVNYILTVYGQNVTFPCPPDLGDLLRGGLREYNYANPGATLIISRIGPYQYRLVAGANDPAADSVTTDAALAIDHA